MIGYPLPQCRKCPIKSCRDEGTQKGAAKELGTNRGVKGEKGAESARGTEGGGDGNAPHTRPAPSRRETWVLLTTTTSTPPIDKTSTGIRSGILHRDILWPRDHRQFTRQTPLPGISSDPAQRLAEWCIGTPRAGWVGLNGLRFNSNKTPTYRVSGRWWMECAEG